MAPAVAVVGSLNLDLVVGVERLPGRGETVIGLRTTTGPGGKGANQAAAAAALSPGVSMIGRVGDDQAGRSLLDDLADRGVDISGVLPTPNAATGTATVAVEQDSGENLIIVAPGANAAVTAVDVCTDAVRDAAIVLLQLEIPVSTVAAAVAHATGRTVLNPAPAQELPEDLMQAVDLLVPNEWELAHLAGVPASQRSTDEIAELVRKLTAGDVVVTLGGRGALVVPRTGLSTHVPPPRVRAVDTTGAGDCFCGALCVSLAEGADLVQATRFAVAAAALSTTAEGARGLLPDESAVRAALG